MKDNQPSELSLESRMFTKLQTEHKKKIVGLAKKISPNLSYLWNALVLPLHSVSRPMIKFLTI